MAQSQKDLALSDGRLQRSERSREAIVQALLSLVREGAPRPTAERVAEKAGVGIRTQLSTAAALKASELRTTIT